MSDLSVVNVNRLVSETDYWGDVQTPYGKLYLAGNDDGVALRFHHGYEYEPESLAWWTERCQHATAVDVGAHTGLYTLAAYVAGVLLVDSFEPYYLNMARMNMNLRLNGWPVKRCHFSAAASKAGFIRFSVFGHPHHCSTGGHIGVNPKFISSMVPCCRLDDVVTSADVVKIDVEGHACEVLDGMTRLLESRPALLIEESPGLEPRLRALGYSIQRLDDRNVAATV